MQQSPSPIHARQTRQQFATHEDYLSYELGQAVKKLPPLYTRFLAGGISLIVFGALSWAHWSTVDEVAIAPGKLVPSTQMRPVRSLGAGTITSVNVEAGDRISKGEVLLERDLSLTQGEIQRLENSAQLIRNFSILRRKTE